MKTITHCAAAAALSLLCALGLPAHAAGAAPAKADSGSIDLGNVDGPDAEMAPAAEQPAQAAKADPAAATNAAGEEEPAKKVDPLTQHRLDMMQQVQPENYMNANQATSRRYLKIDRNTYQTRMGE